MASISMLGAGSTTVNPSGLLSNMVVVASKTAARMGTIVHFGKAQFSEAVLADVKDLLARFQAYYDNFKAQVDISKLPATDTAKVTDLNTKVKMIMDHWTTVSAWATTGTALSPFSFADPSGVSPASKRLSAVQMTAMQFPADSDQTAKKSSIPMLGIAAAAAAAYFAFKG
jgi:hypothetical protein